MVRSFTSALAATLLVGCGMGSQHPGEIALVRDAATGCNTQEDLVKLIELTNVDHNIERAQRELFTPWLCRGFEHDEVVLVVAENGDYRKTRRANGSELWTHWMSLSPCSTACDWITDNIDKVWKKQAAEHKGYFGRNRPSP